MNRSLLIILAAAAFIFLLIATFRVLRVEDTSGPVEQEKGIDRDRIGAFWHAYRQATRFRIEGEYSRAAEYYREALRINPSHEDSLYYMGHCFFELSQYEESTKTYRRLIELNPSSQRGLSQLGMALSTPTPGAILDFGEARNDFLRCIDINQEQSGPFIQMGLLAYREEKWEEALHYFKTAAGFRSPEGLFLAGNVLYRQHEYPQAIQLFRKVLKLEAHEQALAGRGVSSEGNLQPISSSTDLTPLEAAAVKSQVYLRWSLARANTSSNQVDRPTHLKQRRQPIHFARSRELVLPKGMDTDELGRGAWGDYDGDGRLDLAVGTPRGKLLLYHNEGRRLSEEAGARGLGGARNAWGVTWVDSNCDGRLDLYLIRPGFVGRSRNALYLNAAEAENNNRFTEATAEAGLGGERTTSAALFLDYDHDGDPDLFEVGTSDADHLALRLYENLDRGRFQERSREAGFDLRGSAVDCKAGDYDGDGFEDLLVLRWKRPAVLLRNNQDGTFTDATERAGLREVGKNALAALFFDYDRDGRIDLLVVDYASYSSAMQSLLDPEISKPGGNRLFRNVGDGTFEDVTAMVGLDGGYGSVQAIAADVDRDGWMDLVLANGGLEPYRLEPSLILRNQQGKRFVEYAYLPGFDDPSNALGVAAADMDEDGFPEFYLAGTGLFTMK